MRVLFEGVVPVAYGQFYVQSQDVPDMLRAFAGQVNGLCGAGDPGGLFLVTGSRDGQVRVRVELHEQEPPPAADIWEEVVEAEFVPRSETVALVPWADAPVATMPLSEDDLLPPFRVRYCATGMDRGNDPWGGRDPDEMEEDDYSYLDERPDSYLLCFWPDPDGGRLLDGDLRADAILRQTSGSAAYWHSNAGGRSSAPSLWDQVEEVLAERREQARRAEEFRQREEARRWGGRPPGERLSRVRGNVHGIARLDRDLVDGVAAAGDATQRRIAVWAARQAFTHAGIADLDWLAPAWAALDRGDPLPAGFTDMTALFERVTGPREPGTMRFVLSLRPAARVPSMDEMLDRPVHAPSMAVPALTATACEDPLQAALEALWAAAATYADRRAELLAAVREAFPEVSRRT